MNWWTHIKLALLPALRAEHELRAARVACRYRGWVPAQPPNAVGMASIRELTRGLD